MEAGMRADRLLSILLLLQNQGKMTAKDLSEALEVTVRTIYRDIDALCNAGVPIYSDSGHGGGFSLLNDYHTNLTGLSEDELEALLMLRSLAPLSDLGLSKALQAALLKISAALPESSRSKDEIFRQCFYFDSTWWQQSDIRIPHLHVVQDAVLHNHKLLIAYQTPFSLKVERIVSPFGLVAKAGKWYVVCERNESLHVYNISNLADALLCEDKFERPADFELEKFWNHWCSEREAFLTNFIVSVRVAPNFVHILPMYFGNQINQKIVQAEPSDAKSWIPLELTFESFEAARDRILGFGRGVEVLEPKALQLSIRDYAEQIIDLYQDK
jgi:predicted DNA-binding transcriptional regulator YafY